MSVHITVFLVVKRCNWSWIQTFRRNIYCPYPRDRSKDTIELLQIRLSTCLYCLATN